MAKEEIVEGLRLAVSKGESLRSAMMSFYNAGYSKQDIEDAARAMQMPQFTQLTATQQNTQGAPQTTTSGVQKQVSPKFQALNPQNSQKVSNYESASPGGPSKTTITFLVVVLFVLVGALIAIFLFKNELSSILNNLIG